MTLAGDSKGKTMEFNRASLPETAAALKSGELDLVAYITEIIRRVEATDAEVRALLPEPGRRERLIADAKALLAKYPDPTTRPPLFGVPVGVKDLLRADGFPTRAGSYLPPEALAGAEASLVTRIKEAGAVILGKTETDEFAHSEPPVTRNPRNPKHSPGGSSGGSAAAIAVGLCPIAIGTQTCMSIIGPASFCGVVGYKPSWGTIPADGLVLMSESIDTIGFLAQDVASVTLAAAVLTDIGEVVPAANKAILGVPLSLMRSKLHDYAEDVYRKQLRILTEAGFEVKPVEFMDFDYVQEAFRHTSLVLSYEMARVHKDWFPKYAHLYRKRTADGIRFGQTVTGEQYKAGQAFAKDFRARIADLMDTEGVDLWTLPGSNGAAPEGYQTTGWIDQTGIWGLAGLGSVVVPAGFAPNGLPLGLQFLPRFGDDAKLLAWVGDIEPLFADVKAKLMQTA